MAARRMRAGRAYTFRFTNSSPIILVKIVPGVAMAKDQPETFKENPDESRQPSV
jgi:hypothetical protein